MTVDNKRTSFSNSNSDNDRKVKKIKIFVDTDKPIILQQGLVYPQGRAIHRDKIYGYSLKGVLDNNNKPFIMYGVR